METTIIVISIFLLILLVASIYIFLYDNFLSLEFKAGLIAFLSAIVFLILAISITRKPKAIDVYKGKTTLEISYKDEVPIDSVVVWK